MTRVSTVAGIGALWLAGAALLSCAWAAPGGEDSCTARVDVLGVARVLEIDTTAGPKFGTTHKGGTSFLAEAEVVLTFDDGPLRPHTSAVLKALDAHCTKATFFMVGRMAIADPAMVKQVASRGHTIGAHTWTHARLQTAELDHAKNEIELGFSAVARAAGKPIAPFFRFPYLRTSNTAFGYLKSRDVASFAIDVDSRDFDTRSAETVQRTVLAQLKKARKGILLFHDIQPSTAAAMKGLLDQLKANGFKVVHLVPKAAAATLADYDTIIDRELKRRKIAKTSQLLAPRSMTWPQAGARSGGPGKEDLPWAKPITKARKATVTKTSADKAWPIAESDR